MAKMGEWLKSPKWLLILALGLILIGSLLASMFNSSFFSTKVSYIEFETERGTLAGLLYMPRGAGPNDPRPVIITTHGYLNTKEMQDAPAVELSRRGYIVLALDMYDHGNSRWNSNIPVGSQFGTFWIYSQFDAAAYMYQQPYTKKDARGNGYIALSGHSMGGFSTLIAMHHDEMQALKTGYRMIHAGISVGADFLYTTLLGRVPQDQMQAAFGSRTVGIIGAQFDEFFFNHPSSPPGQTVRHKDYPNTPSGKQFLGLAQDGPRGSDGTFYTVSSGELKVDDAVVRGSETGRHIIYTPYETHPWNHLSAKTTAHLIEFYESAFSGVKSASQETVNGQIWQLKEFFNLVALVGFFLLIVPIMSVLLKLPLFKQSITAETAPVQAAVNGQQKSLYWIFIVLSALMPALLFPALMNKTRAEMAVLGTCALILCAVLLVAGIVLYIRNKNAKPDRAQNWFTGGLATAFVSVVIYLLLASASTSFALSYFFIEPTVNQILFWAVINGCITALIILGFYFFSKKSAGAAPANYGLVGGSITIAASLVTAVCGIALAYLTVFLMQAVFKVDFRIWVLAVRVFKCEHLATTLRYIPFFFIFYFINTIGINANTRGKKCGTLIAILINIGGLLLWTAIQYGKLFATGVAWYPAMALNGILLFALIPCLGIAAVYARSLYKQTNNVYLAAFTNTILFTLITCANTAMFWNMV